MSWDAVTPDQWNEHCRSEWQKIMANPIYQLAQALLEAGSPARCAPYETTAKSGDERIGIVQGWEMRRQRQEALIEEPPPPPKQPKIRYGVDPDKPPAE